MTLPIAIEINARWESGVVADGQQARQALLVELTPLAPTVDESDRRPVGLSLVVDRSGSMAGGRLAAAIEAALGITAALGPADRLSLVSFDDTARTHFSNLALDATGQREAHAAIAQLHTGGCTNLGGGWLAGARCASALLDQQAGFDDAHVLVLSDGQANRGLTDPVALARHAGEMASRGIYSSAAGIGNHYSPLQLDAIAEAGGGSLHDAESAQDIVDVVLGEVGDVQALAVRDATLHIEFPPSWRVTMLAQTAEIAHTGDAGDTGVLTVQLGNLRYGRTRPVPIMVHLEAGRAGTQETMNLHLTWTDAATGQSCESKATKATLNIASARDARSAPRDLEVIRRVSDLWQANLAYQAMRHNEEGDFVRARAVFYEPACDFAALVENLDDADQRGDIYWQAASRVSRRWGGRSKRAAMTRAKKTARNEVDHRRDSGDWKDRLFD